MSDQTSSILSAKCVHFVGIGGIGMSALARMLRARGVGVRGSDLNDSPLLETLRQMGAQVFTRHDAANLDDANLVVVSTAIDPNNPEVRAAQTNGTPIIHRSELLAALMEGKRGIAVAGTHGKSTTTAMLATVLLRAGVDPSVILGAELPEIGNVLTGTGHLFVAEADESDGSFLHLRPEASIVTNVECDHMEYFGTEQTVIDSFDAFLQNVRPGGLAIVSADCANARKLGTRADVHRVNYGTSDSAQWKVTNYAADARRSRFVLETAGRAMSQVTLSVHGVHNACNATAALAAAEWAGVPLEDAIRFIAAYAGIRRRMEIVSENEGITIVDDYAHHPTEVRVTLRAARERWGGRLIAIFQPHRYSRTRDLHASFSDAFDDADHIIVTEIYGAYEMPIEGVSGRLVADSIRFAGGRGPVEFLPDKCQVFAHLREHLCSGDVLLFLGAGDITHWAHEFSNHPQIGT